ncbi:MAG: hypothetical protein ACU88J_12980 [Gammaproteobacteria bacterium]
MIIYNKIKCFLFLLLLLPVSVFSATTCESEPTDMQIQYGELINCKLDVGADEDFFRFFGEVGDRISVVTNQTTVPSPSIPYVIPCFNIIAPDGTTAAHECTTALYIGFSTDIVLDQTGTYTISVFSGRSITPIPGDYHVALTCLSGTCGPTPECTASYDSSTQIARIPCIVVDGQNLFDVELGPPYNLLSIEPKN